MLGCKIEDKLESTYESLVDFFLIRIVWISAHKMRFYYCFCVARPRYK
jgi:hypothetical protein